MSNLRSIAGTPQTRRWVVLLLTALLVLSAMPAHAGYAYWRPRVFVAPRVVVPVVPFWAPYAYPPVAIQSPPPVVVQPPSLQASWYYCDHPKGLLPACPTVPWRLAAGSPDPAIGGETTCASADACCSWCEVRSAPAPPCPPGGFTREGR